MLELKLAKQIVYLLRCLLNLEDVEEHLLHRLAQQRVDKLSHRLFLLGYFYGFEVLFCEAIDGNMLDIVGKLLILNIHDFDGCWVQLSRTGKFVFDVADGVFVFDEHAGSFVLEGDLQFYRCFTTGIGRVPFLLYEFNHVFEKHEGVPYRLGVADGKGRVQVAFDLPNELVYSSLPEAVAHLGDVVEVERDEVLIEYGDYLSVLAFLKD